MSTLTTVNRNYAVSVDITGTTLKVCLVDRRQISVPLAWFPRLLHGSRAERKKYELIGRGEGIHWPELDEDISVESLLAGRPSLESPSSLKKWILARKK